MVNAALSSLLWRQAWRLPKRFFPTLFSPSNFLSTLQSHASPDPENSLSARMRFVFDQIDAIEKERAQKDETLQRIKAWHESRIVEDRSGGKVKEEYLEGHGDSEDAQVVDMEAGRETSECVKKEVEIVHPWPEWIELMERLVQQNYFNHVRKDEDRMMADLGFDVSEVAEQQVDFTRDFKTVQPACLNFGRDRFDILRSLSRQDIQVLVGHGCPNMENKVVYGAKLLRKYGRLDEGDVCSSCPLRNSCGRAYLLVSKEDEAQTHDLMRILLTFGFEPISGAVVNKSLLKIKAVKTVVRKLLHAVVKLSAVPIDPSLPRPVKKITPPKVKQPPLPPKKRVGRDDIEMKKGDWLCPKCDFMNFAKNTKCLRCDANRPKRQLLPGEWECPACNFLNYRRNVVCFHCEAKRPIVDKTESFRLDDTDDSRERDNKLPKRDDISKAWNFDFDDEESDGADVAAFEYADSPRAGKYQSNNPLQEDELDMDGHIRNICSRPAESDNTKSSFAFNDFDDEEDGVDNYELDDGKQTPVRDSSFHVENCEEDLDVDSDAHPNPRYERGGIFKPNRDSRQRGGRRGSRPAMSEDDDDFDDVDDFPPRNRSRGKNKGFPAAMSEDDDDGDDDFRSNRDRGQRSGRRGSRVAMSEEDDDGDDFPPRNRSTRTGLRRGRYDGRDRVGSSRGQAGRDYKPRGRGYTRRGDFEDAIEGDDGPERRRKMRVIER